MADINVGIILEMLFLTFSNADVLFVNKKLTKRPYIILKALPTTRQIKIIDKIEFAKVALDENIKAFVVHVVSQSLSSKMTIYPAWKA